VPVKLENWDTIRLGDAVIHRIADMEGVAWPATAIFRDLAGDALREAAARCPQAVNPSDGTLTLFFNSYIIKTPDTLCLIDTGIGNGKERADRPLWHRRNGDFMQRVGALGFAPDDFDIVINTHLHADHVGWNTVQDGPDWTPTFRNARYLVPRIELDFWRKLALEKDAAHVLHGAYADSVQPILDAGLYEQVELPVQVAPGLTMEAAPGHTYGMCVVRFRNPAGEVLFLGDVLHSPIQFAAPDLTSNFCVDPAQARATRRRLLDGCAGTDTIVASYHGPAPVFGTVVPEGAGYALRPLG
jgi:glyoxylase-like metal-dependent hydrolase (beta-lactamase superfamily II)